MSLCICSVIDLRSSDHILDVICDQLLNRRTANMARFRSQKLGSEVDYRMCCSRK